MTPRGSAARAYLSSTAAAIAPAQWGRVVDVSGEAREQAKI